ncbi:MAG: galactose-1-phosphate uridylyltransferase [Candidatus Aenigmatarchaeota archaeon]
MEIRKDYLLDRWVILSPKRAKRPHTIKEDLPLKDENCIFCPGNEDKTPKSIIEKPTNNWKIRVFENKYPAVVKGKAFSNITKFTTSVSAYGKHYIMIDTPIHNLHPGDYDLDQWRIWFETLSDIIYEEMSDENIKYVSVFKNHGVEAGASQPHPHTQIISLPIVPTLIKQELEKAKEFYQFNGKCAFCEIIDTEIKNKKRIVFENNKILVICPYAPQQPFEAWIFPKQHIASINLGNKLRDELLDALGKILKAYKQLDVSFNFMLHMLYPRMENPESYHFHIEILPRIEKDAGFEYGTGMNITTVTPEDSAKFLRKFFK